MSTKKSVFLADHTVEWIESSTSRKINWNEPEGPKWSEAINATFEQLRFLLRESLPDLSMEEWETLLNVYSGCYFPAHGVPARIASDMMDKIGAVDIGEVETNTPDYAALIRKTHKMSQPEQLAILYFVQIFWSTDWKGEWDEIFSSICSKF